MVCADAGGVRKGSKQQVAGQEQVKQEDCESKRKVG